MTVDMAAKSGRKNIADCHFNGLWKESEQVVSLVSINTTLVFRQSLQWFVNEKWPSSKGILLITFQTVASTVYRRKVT